MNLMKKYFLIIFLMLFGLIGPLSKTVTAAPPPLSAPLALSFIEIQITGTNEFVVIQNSTSGPINLGTYWLYGHNNYNPSAAGTTTSTQQLPSARLDPGQTLLLSANAQNTCGAAVAGRLSISLVDGISSGGSGGSLELLNSSGGIVDSSDTDFVSWYKDASADIKNLTSSSGPVYYRYQNTTPPPAFSWQPASFSSTDPCQLLVASEPADTGAIGWLLPGDPPPVTFVDSSSASSSSLPAADIGLMAPLINELLPNPAEPASDDEDEFIELYNPNNAAFDLTGFRLQVGTTTLHTYTFPEGTNLPPKSFTAFYSIDTNLALSNSGGQARLLDPLGNIISQTDVYDTAKEGKAWALANGKWYWTTSPTPDAANIINQPMTTKALSVGSTTSKKAASKSSAKPKVKAASASNNNTTTDTSPSSNLNPLILAGIGGSALLYAGYEYRHDLANRLYQLRRHRAARRTAGQVAEATDSSRVTV